MSVCGCLVHEITVCEHVWLSCPRDYRVRPWRLHSTTSAFRLCYDGLCASSGLSQRRGMQGWLLDTIPRSILASRLMAMHIALKRKAKARAAQRAAETEAKKAQ